MSYQKWRLLSLEVDRRALAIMVTPEEVMEYIMRVGEENRLIMIILLWFLWTERNIVREEGSADTLARSIRLYAAEISKQQEKESPSTETERPKPQWSKPPEGTVKLNCDASFKADSKTGTVGVSSYVISTHRSGMYQSSAKCLPCGGYSRPARDPSSAVYGD